VHDLELDAVRERDVMDSDLLVLVMARSLRSQVQRRAIERQAGLGDDEIEVIKAGSAHRRDAKRADSPKARKTWPSEVGNEQLTLALERSAR
jgi:hypothetical protein